MCGDFAFYQFPTEDFWRKLFAAHAAGFPLRLQSARTDHLQGVPRASALRRAGRQAERSVPGRAACSNGCSCGRCWPYRDRTALLIFEFGAFGRRSFDDLPGSWTAWTRSWPRCRPISATPWKSATPIPGARLFRVPARHSVAHVYNAWSRMPELRAPDRHSGFRHRRFQVCRALLRRGRAYEDAVARFAPYTEIQDPNPEARDSMRILIGRAAENRSGCSCS